MKTKFKKIFSVLKRIYTQITRGGNDMSLEGIPMQQPVAPVVPTNSKDLLEQLYNMVIADPAALPAYITNMPEGNPRDAAVQAFFKEFEDKADNILEEVKLFLGK